MIKLGVATRHEAARRAWEEGWISPQCPIRQNNES